jgi:hypothetical protein
MLPLPPLRVWEILSAEEESPSSAAWNYPEVADNLAYATSTSSIVACS